MKNILINNIMSKIPLYTQTTHDWHCNKNQPNKPYAVDLNVGTNEYIFGRVTPDNKFIVTTGLVKDPKPYGIKMVGGKKKKMVVVFLVFLKQIYQYIMKIIIEITN